MIRNRIALALLASSVALSAPVLAADPSRHEIYEAATTGHLDQAQKMIDQVLKDHPGSAEAHYIAAEVYAREGNFGVARGQLAEAERIDPSDAFAKPEAVRALKAELAGSPARAATGGGYVVPVRSEPAHSFPFFPVLLLIGLIAIVWMVVRRRSAPVVYTNSYPAAGGPGGGGYAAPGYGPGYGPTPMGGGGIGSGIAGGLASGLAVGAGVVAGEELAHHFLDGGERREFVQSPPDQVAPPQNADMGGEDFGTTGSDGWDDSGSGSGGGDFGGGGGGGDDWT
jgi:hypothetical protein